MSCVDPAGKLDGFIILAGISSGISALFIPSYRCAKRYLDYFERYLERHPRQTPSKPSIPTQPILNQTDHFPKPLSTYDDYRLLVDGGSELNGDFMSISSESLKDEDSLWERGDKVERGVVTLVKEVPDLRRPEKVRLNAGCSR